MNLTIAVLMSISGISGTILRRGIDMTLKEYWIVKGRVTCQDCAEIYGCNIGDVEWQFSDGPAGARGSSQDYHDILKGLSDLSPAIFHFEKES